MAGNPEWAIAKRIPNINLSRAVIAVIALGIVLRVIRWLQNYPLWCDETMLAANVLERDWTELAQPLAYRQVCPLGFLALEWIVVRLLGFSELLLRLIPVLCAVASVPLFHFLARRVLGAGTMALLLAVALFAVSEAPIRYAAEVKPYSADLLVALVLLSLAVAWLQAPGQIRPVWVMAAISPLAIATSFPSVFVIGTIAIVGLNEVMVRRGKKLLVAYGAFVAAAGLAVVGMFALGQYKASPRKPRVPGQILVGRVSTFLARSAGPARLVVPNTHRAVVCVSLRRESVGRAVGFALRMFRPRDRRVQAPRRQDHRVARVAIRAGDGGRRDAALSLRYNRSAGSVPRAVDACAGLCRLGLALCSRAANARGAVDRSRPGDHPGWDGTIVAWS